jgi:prepilin-type N-terminal cleavage/methylation domain-containing protein
MLKPSPAHRPARLKPGFTLLEILVSLVVLAIGCLAAISMQTSTMEGGALAYHMTVASFLAESEIERLQSLTRGRARVEPATPANLTRDGSACPADGSRGPCYTRTTTVLPGAPTSQNLWVSIRVDFPGQSSNSKRGSLVYDTLIFYLDF